MSTGTPHKPQPNDEELKQRQREYEDSAAHENRNRPADDPGPTRTLGNRPHDPNRIDKGKNIPPGVPDEHVWDPGSQTPNAPKTDNRS